ncbi:hypothetical protein I3842_09G201800 [Carya illinoinensis]|uniref:Protein MIZU-KUSSEI 1-like n=1 Tax=Carya illinoinensis TaxID=32201 RepID=A0A922J8K8_CARIL|nr:hypothetical protein I3842_09G201800 [Carya illinoinensis]
MGKIDTLRRLLPSCFFLTAQTNAATATTTTKKRLSTSLRDDLPDYTDQDIHKNQDRDSQASSTSDDSVPASINSSTTPLAQPRPSRSMVVGTIFGPRRGHVWFCVQQDRLSSRPTVLLELSILTNQLVKEMRSGLVRIALECDKAELGSCPLRSVPVWTMHCNGLKLGFAAKRKASERVRSMLKTMQSTTVGAGVIPAGFGSSGSEEIIYMRANYEHVVGNSDSESFHLINLDEYCSTGQEFSVFLLRSRNGKFL